AAEGHPGVDAGVAEALELREQRLRDLVAGERRVRGEHDRGLPRVQQWLHAQRRQQSSDHVQPRCVSAAGGERMDRGGNCDVRAEVTGNNIEGIERATAAAVAPEALEEIDGWLLGFDS